MKKTLLSSMAILVGICVLLGEAWPQTQPKTTAIDYPTNKAGHTPHVEYPEKFNKLALEFLFE